MASSFAEVRNATRRRLVSELVQRVSDLEAGSENFKIAFNFIIGNLEYHRFLDVNPNSVKQKLQGLMEKFQIHNQEARALKLRVLVDQFLNAQLNDTTKDVHYSILLLLLELSESPLSVPLRESPSGSTSQEHLRDMSPDSPLALSNGYDSDWTFEDSSDEDSSASDSLFESHSDAQTHTIPPEQTQMTAVSPFHSATDTGVYFLPLTALDPALLTPSFELPRQRPSTHAGFLAVTACDQLTGQLQELHTTTRGSSSGMPLYHWPFQTITERSLLRHLTSIVRGAATTLFEVEPVTLAVRLNRPLQLAHLSPGSLQRLLQQFMSAAELVLQTHALSNQLASSCSCTQQDAKSVVCSGPTLEALALFVRDRIHRFHDAVGDIDRVYANDQRQWLAGGDVNLDDGVQSGDEQVQCSLLWLSLWLRPHVSIISFLRDLLQPVSCCWCGAQHCTCVAARTSQALTSLWTCALEAHQSSARSNIALEGFWRCLTPYLLHIERLLEHGKVEDPHNEFPIVVQQSFSASEGDTEQEEKKQRSAHSDWEACGWRTTAPQTSTSLSSFDSSSFPSFLLPLGPALLLSGRSRWLLHHLRSDLSVESTLTLAIRAHFDDVLRSRSRESVSLSALSGSQLEPWRDFHWDRFISVSNPNVFHIKTTAPNRPSSSPDQSEFQEVSEEPLMPFVPVKVMIQRILLEPLSQWCRTINRTLVKSVLQSCEVLKHLESLRSVLFFGAGADMAQFSNSIFNKIDSMEGHQLDSYDLSVSLQECARGPCGLRCELFSASTGSGQQPDGASRPTPPARLATGSIRSVAAVSLHYQIPWPLDFIVDAESEERYNRVFRFLLQIKWAFYALKHAQRAIVVKPRKEWAMADRLRTFGTIDANSVKTPLDTEDKQLVEIPSTSASAGDFLVLSAREARLLRRRMQLFLAELLHFVRNLEHYVMNRVLLGSWAVFQEQLSSAADFEQLRSLHDEYLSSIIEHTLLHPRSTPLMEAILKSLESALRLRHFTQKLDGVAAGPTLQHVKEFDAIVESFRSSHRFLLTVLSKSVQRGIHVHLVDVFQRLDWNCFYAKLYGFRVDH